MRLGPAGVGGGYGFELSQDETEYILGFSVHSIGLLKVKVTKKAFPMRPPLVISPGLS